MGIHYDYKSTRGNKAQKKEAKRKARAQERRAKKSYSRPKTESKQMHDINKTITLSTSMKKNFKEWGLTYAILTTLTIVFLWGWGII